MLFECKFWYLNDYFLRGIYFGNVVKLNREERVVVSFKEWM